MKKQAVLMMIIMLVVSVVTGGDFQNIAMAAEQPATTETTEPEPDNDSIYAAEEDAEAIDMSGDEEEIVTGGDSEEGEPISPDGEVEDVKSE
ncbi:MAG: hypothetical protein C4522_12245 [Desulfobacteraceae bacterium]|nr:MAG: hypothetical protein C4522_12245 [Desulfobacteraceae bacterium]